VIDQLRAWLFPPFCVACDAPGTALCASCAPRERDAIDFTIAGIPAFALGPYEGPLRDTIVAMKRGLRDPLPAFAALLDRAPLEGVLVPLPTTRRRVAERGFDQTILLARSIAGRRGLPVAEVLEKRGRPQAGGRRSQRLAATGRFALRRNASIPRVVTVIDDVCTTGATLHDAIHVLRAAGSDVRRVIVVARTGGTPSAFAGSIRAQ
jgi:predicted amidophosphoribosyltransferase